MWDIVNTKLKSILQSNDKIQNVYDFEASKLSGTPIATITASANENDYATTTENRRTYAFNVRLFVRRESGNDNEKDAEDAMRDMVDDVLDDFDKNHQLSNLDAKTGYTFLFMEAAPSSWGYVGRENEYRVAEINLRVHFYVDVNQIS